MKIRQTTTTEGKRITFAIGDKNYYMPDGDKSIVFNGSFTDHNFCVCYTKIVRDCGYRNEMRYGVPALVRYDNGNVGYQCFNYFIDKNEAIKDFNARQKLTPKCGKSTFAYADVFFVEKN